MSKKDVELYYQQMVDQYMEMNDNLKEMEEYIAKNIVEPERIDAMKEMVEPIKNNYRTLSYIMYLLNKPNKKSKISRYDRQNKKFLKNIPFKNTQSGLVEENKSCINNMKSQIMGDNND